MRLLSLVFVVAVHHDMLVGGFSDGKWLDAAAAGKLMVAQGNLGAELFGLEKGSLGKVVLKKPKVSNPSDGPAPDWSVETAGHKAGGKEPLFAVTGKGKPLKRTPRLQPVKEKAYLAFVKERLVAKGLTKAEPRIESIARVDLEGDGTEEVIVSATTGGDYPMSKRAAQTYSMVFVRKIVKGKVVTVPIREEFHTKDGKFEEGHPNKYALSAVLDLDGDGKMELILSDDMYEGVSECVYRLDGETANLLGCAGFGA